MNNENPYQPPKAGLVDEDAATAELASLWQRFGAAILDAIIGMACGLPIMFAFGMFEYLKRGQAAPLSLLIPSTLLGFAAFVVVHGYFLKKNGQTIGKKIVGIRIAALDDTVPALGRVLGLRYLPISIVTLIPVLGQLLPLIDVLFIFRSDRRCVHDLIAGTRVIRAK